jgi:hypothetical protein
LWAAVGARKTTTTTTELAMIITAKFASVCPCCSVRIHVGSKVEWKSGSPAKHVACAQGSASTVYTADHRRSYTARGRWNGCSCGARVMADGTLSGNACATCRFDSDDC